MGLRKEEIGQTLLETDPRFDFFARWYDGMFRGAPLDWRLQEQVALIPEETWEAGPDAVAEAIAEIERRWQAEQAKIEPQHSKVSQAEVSIVSQRVAANRDALAVSLSGLLEQLDVFRERLRSMNTLEPEVRAEVLEFVDRFRAQLEALLHDLPLPGEDIPEEQANRLVLWLRSYQGVVKTKLSQYSTPENVGEATVPSGIILFATGIGAMLGAPLAGVAVGGLIVGQLKPGDAAKALLKPEATKTEASSPDAPIE